ncbi:MAG: hypothetical protein KJN81_01015, partial [Acidimicrobiia bacterium]|nr:hypothetical protein [Acidimicrobiia bacterium]NNL26987.1 hypothetical protein [Acidimicrobiia bacterium]
MTQRGPGFQHGRLYQYFEIGEDPNRWAIRMVPVLAILFGATVWILVGIAGGTGQGDEPEVLGNQLEASATAPDTGPDNLLVIDDEEAGSTSTTQSNSTTTGAPEAGTEVADDVPTDGDVTSTTQASSNQTTATSPSSSSGGTNNDTSN